MPVLTVCSLDFLQLRRGHEKGAMMIEGQRSDSCAVYAELPVGLRDIITFSWAYRNTIMCSILIALLTYQRLSRVAICIVATRAHCDGSMTDTFDHAVLRYYQSLSRKAFRNLKNQNDR